MKNTKEEKRDLFYVLLWMFISNGNIINERLAGVNH